MELLVWWFPTMCFVIMIQERFIPWFWEIYLCKMIWWFPTMCFVIMIQERFIPWFWEIYLCKMIRRSIIFSILFWLIMCMYFNHSSLVKKQNWICVHSQNKAEITTLMWWQIEWFPGCERRVFISKSVWFIIQNFSLMTVFSEKKVNGWVPRCGWSCHRCGPSFCKYLYWDLNNHQLQYMWISSWSRRKHALCVHWPWMTIDCVQSLREF